MPDNNVSSILRALDKLDIPGCFAPDLEVSEFLDRARRNYVELLGHACGLVWRLAGYRDELLDCFETNEEEALLELRRDLAAEVRGQDQAKVVRP